MQKNLPDPNFHLVFESDSLQLIGPVSKVYQYEMRGSGGIVGVKFNLGALDGVLDKPVSDYVDTQINAQTLFSHVPETLDLLDQAGTDEQRVDALQGLLATIPPVPQKPLKQLNQAIQLIKTEPELVKVEQICERLYVSKRTLQRLFQRYVGLSPKWLLRKYRLSQVLAMLEQNQPDVHDVIAALGYTDQAHLIHDFQHILGSTPRQYSEATA